MIIYILVSGIAFCLTANVFCQENTQIIPNPDLQIKNDKTERMKYMDKIFKNLNKDSDHECMTYAAIKVLSEYDQEYLEPEKELLIMLYCEFPDYTANCYGEIGGSSGFPEAPRWRDVRREWDLSYYLGWDTFLNKKTWPGGKKEGMYLHALPDSYPAVKLYFQKALDSFLAGQHADAVRFIGVMAHHIEDPVTFSNMQVLHRRLGASTHIDHRKIDITGYRPQLLTKSVKGAAEYAEQRLRKAVEYAESMSLEIRKCVKNDEMEKLAEIARESDQEGSRALADIIHTIIFLAGKQKEKEGNPVGKNLINNGNFEKSEDLFTPEGWFTDWHDMNDHTGRAIYEGEILRSNDYCHSGTRSLKLMWTPEKGIEWMQRWKSAIPVIPGEKYKCSVWLKTHEATGENRLLVHLYERNNQIVKTFQSKSFQGNQEWVQVSLTITVPPKAEKMKVGLFSANNTGAVWFDEAELQYLTTSENPERKTAPKKETAQNEDCVLNLCFKEKPTTEISSIVDKSTYGTEHTGANFPIISCSGGQLADLFFNDKTRKSVLKFDGKDDFLEIAYSRIMDVLNFPDEITIAFWMSAEKKQDAYLVAKEYNHAKKYDGYSIELDRSGTLKWNVGREHRKVSLETDAYPCGKWVHVAVTADNNSQKIFLNGIIIAEAKQDKNLSPALKNDFYIGADTGVASFFSGMLDEVKMFRRALSEQEIKELAKSIK